MDRRELEYKKMELMNRLQGINNWIMQNPGTDPNMYEMTDCLIEYGNIASLYRNIVFEEESAKGNTISGYDIVRLADLYDLDHEVRKMMKLRGVIPLDKGEEYDGFEMEDAGHGFKAVKSDFFAENADAAHFLNDIRYLTITGSYAGEDILGKDGLAEKKETFARIAGVSLYIWQQSKNNLDFVYDNRNEYEQMRHGLDSLNELFGEVGVYQYEGGNDINNMFQDISKSSSFGEKTEEFGMRM